MNEAELSKQGLGWEGECPLSSPASLSLLLSPEPRGLVPGLWPSGAEHRSLHFLGNLDRGLLLFVMKGPSLLRFLRGGGGGGRSRKNTIQGVEKTESRTWIASQLRSTFLSPVPKVVAGRGDVHLAQPFLLKADALSGWRTVRTFPVCPGPGRVSV